jgi:hypothetical protein
VTISDTYEKHGYIKLTHPPLFFVELCLDRVFKQQQQYICIHQCLLSVLEGKDMMMDSPRSEIHDNQGYEGESRSR